MQLPALHPAAIGAVAAVLLLLLLLLCYSLLPRSTTKSPNRQPLPFDVEGGASATNSAVLPQAVIEAADSGDVARLRAWISDPRCVIDACSAVDGATALHAAAAAGHVNVVRLLLEAGADALAVDAEMRTPLHHVAAAGHGICVKALLEAGSDPEGADSEGNTSLQLAELGRHMGCLRMMRLFQERKMTADESKAHRRVK